MSLNEIEHSKLLTTEQQRTPHKTVLRAHSTLKYSQLTCFTSCAPCSEFDCWVPEKVQWSVYKVSTSLLQWQRNAREPCRRTIKLLPCRKIHATQPEKWQKTTKRSAESIFSFLQKNLIVRYQTLDWTHFSVSFRGHQVAFYPKVSFYPTKSQNFCLTWSLTCLLCEDKV